VAQSNPVDELDAAGLFPKGKPLRRKTKTKDVCLLQLQTACWVLHVDLTSAFCVR
jgi:hypothetical protein